MKSIYNTAVRERNSLATQLDQFAGFGPSPNLALQSQISSSLNVLHGKIEQYETLARQEPSRERQQELLQKSDKLRDSLAQNRARFDLLLSDRQQQQQQQLQQQQQQQHHQTQPGKQPAPAAAENHNPAPHSATLHGRRGHGTNPGSIPTAFDPTADPSYGPAYGSYATQPQRFNDPLDAGTGRESSWVGRLDDIIGNAQLSVGNLANQQRILKSTQSKLYSVGSTLGISGKTIQMVERRAREDKFVFGGIVVTFFVFAYFVLRFFRG